jgi:predicted MFS family arabinose efflux permease
METTHAFVETRNAVVEPPSAGGWPAVMALTLCVSTLIASEFMPVSLLTPIASALQVTEGQAGLAIGVSGIFAVITSLFIAAATKGVDRRMLLLSLTGLMIVSGAIVGLGSRGSAGRTRSGSRSSVRFTDC